MTFNNSILAGDTLVRRAMQSENFVTTVSGWRIARDGDAEFQDIFARGDITASSLNVQTNQGSISVVEGSFNNALVFDGNVGDFADPATIEAQKFGTIAQFEITGPLADVVSPPSTAIRPIVQTQHSESDNSTLAISADRVNIGSRVSTAGMRPTATQDNTTETITSTGFAGLGYGHSFTAPPSGDVWVYLWTFQRLKPTDTSRHQIWTSFQIREGTIVGSGTIVFASTAFNSVSLGVENENGSDCRIAAGVTKLVEGLTSGNSYNVEVTHRILTTTNVTGTEFGRNVTTTPVF